MARKQKDRKICKHMLVKKTPWQRQLKRVGCLNLVLLLNTIQGVRLIFDQNKRNTGLSCMYVLATFSCYSHLHVLDTISLTEAN